MHGEEATLRPDGRLAALLAPMQPVLSASVPSVALLSKSSPVQLAAAEDPVVGVVKLPGQAVQLLVSPPADQ